MKISVLIISLLLSSGLCFAQKNSDSDRSKAEQIWNLAIQAQGGRERLYDIRNVVIVSREKVLSTSSQALDHVTESLFVFPKKWWTWDDWRPSVLGVTMRMENYETRQNYIARRGQKVADLFPIATERLEQSLDQEGNVKWMAGGTNLLETKWWKPILESATTGMLNGRKVDIIQARINGVRVDYYFDQSSHLAVRTVDYATDAIQHKDVTYITDFSDFTNVDGITVPTKISFPQEKGYRLLSYEFNVDFNEDIFLHAPLPVENASGAWRRKLAPK